MNETNISNIENVESTLLLEENNSQVIENNSGGIDSPVSFADYYSDYNLQLILESQNNCNNLLTTNFNFLNNLFIFQTFLSISLIIYVFLHFFTERRKI